MDKEETFSKTKYETQMIRRMETATSVSMKNDDNNRKIKVLTTDKKQDIGEE